MLRFLRDISGLFFLLAAGQLQSNVRLKGSQRERGENKKLMTLEFCLAQEESVRCSPVLNVVCEDRQQIQYLAAT